MSKINFRNESGYTMLGVLFVFITLAVLGLSITTLSLTSLNTSASERDNQSAFYIAEAGLNKRMKEVNVEIQNIYEKDIVTNETEFYNAIHTELETNGDIKQEVIYDDFEKVNQFQPQAIVTINKEESENEYRIESTGEIGNESRTVFSTIQVDWQDKKGGEGGIFPPFAVFTSGQFSMTDGTIIGDVGTINSSPGGVSFPSGGPTMNGDVYVPGGDKNEPKIVERAHYIHFDIKEINEYYSIPELPTFPNNPPIFNCMPDEPVYNNNGNKHDLIKDCDLNLNNYVVKEYEYTIDKNMKFKNLNIGNGANYYFNIIGDSKEIVVEHLNLANGNVFFNGHGSLTIHVTDKITMASGSTINQSDNISNLNIYYSGSEPIIFVGNSKLYGSIYIKDSNLTMDASGGIMGNILNGGVDKEIKFKGGSAANAQFILAPNSNVVFGAGGKFTGKIISKEFNNSGGANITFDDNFILDKNNPFSEQAIVDYNESIGNGGEGGSSEQSFTITRDSIKEVQ